MNKQFISFLLFLSPLLSAQDLENSSSFSAIRFGITGGINFYSIPTAGSSLNIDVKTNVTSHLDAKVSIGYSILYDDQSYEFRYYGYNQFDATYGTRLWLLDKIRYTMIPVSIGAEYTFLKSNITPFGIVEAGYNFSSYKTEGVTHDGIGGTYETIEEVPPEYQNTAPSFDDGSSFTAGAGIGIKYILSDRIDVNIRYIYHYNEAIIDNNQILMGFTF